MIEFLENLEKYKNEIVPEMVKHFNYENIHQVPKVQKIVLSMGLGRNRDLKQNLEALEIISGQKPVITKARRSISQFSIREGHEIGAKVTLRGAMMYNFFNRLFAALLSWKSFNAIKEKSINLHKSGCQVSIGVPDMTNFAGVRVGGTIRAEGLNITIVTNCPTREETVFLLSRLNVPFRKI
jgi:large subunit ribosomal protein L5